MAADDHLPLTPLSLQVLVALADEPRHGYGILKEIESFSSVPFRSSTGTLYLAIQRLEEEGLIEEDRDRPSPDTRRRYYRLTGLGRDVAIAESRRLASLLDVSRAKGSFRERPLGPASEPGSRG